MDMRKWETLGILGVVGVLLVLPVAVFAYQGYRESQEGPNQAARPPSLAAPVGNAVDGRQVYVNKCSACHGQVGEGSVAGPDIRNMSVGSQFVYTFILDPSGVTPIATMPKIPLTKKEAADVTTYVMGLREGKSLADVTLPAKQEVGPTGGPASGEKAAQAGAASSAGGNAGKGKTFFTGKGCSACHGASGEGTAAGPSLKGIPTDKVKAQIRAPSGKMPPYGPSQVSDSEVDDLIAYLGTLK
ncbi:MAG: cytochrome c [Dehalococcoidia bacterium]|nr:cytochrome c [Dehalococcoidia bacterium]